MENQSLYTQFQNQDDANDAIPKSFWPKVTVVSVSYNSVQCVKKTIESVLQLDYPNLEYLIIDNQSTDGTKELLNTYPGGLFQLISEQDSGPYDAMNKGVKLAKGEWIWFMNMGDHFPNNPMLLRHIFEKPIPEEQAVIYGNVEVFRKDFRYLKQYAEKPESNLKFGVLTLNHQAMVCRKNLFDSFGLFDHKRFKIKADAYWLTKIFLKNGPGAFVYRPEILANYNEEGLSSNSKNFNKMFEEDVMIIAETGKRYQFYLLLVNKYLLSLRVYFLNKLMKNKSLYNLYRRLKYSGLDSTLNK